MSKLPEWLKNMPDSRAKTRAIERFLIRLAALHASEAGTVTELAIMIGINRNTLRSQVSNPRDQASMETWFGINRTVGIEFIPEDHKISVWIRQRLENRDSL